MKEWIKEFISQVSETGILQWLAVIFGVAEVLLAKINNVWLYPAGIIATLVSVYLLLDVQLYAESILNLYYLVMSIYGWYYWLRKKDAAPVQISKATKKEWLITLIISLGGWLVFYMLLKKFTPSDVPVWDALVTSTAWAGMWLLARRKIENWILLNISNAFAIPLLFHKHLAMFSVLTFILFIVAIFGFIEWNNIYKKEQTATPAT
jgi:nicotinamide mononucleotide transporter